MSTPGHNSIADVTAAEASLMDLCRVFAPADFVADCEIIHADAIPAPADSLLVHHNHMTVELERHYGEPVAVRVLEEHLDGDLYTRKINLPLTRSQRIVECGIARINLKHLPGDVRAEILARKKPLGAILIDHQVHRRIKPRYFVRCPANSAVIELLGCEPNPEPVYGRLGTIYCNHEPAIELLEIVVNTNQGLKDEGRVQK